MVLSILGVALLLATALLSLRGRTPQPPSPAPPAGRPARDSQSVLAEPWWLDA